MGVASLTDRVLPHLFPNVDRRRVRGDGDEVARNRAASAALELRDDGDRPRRARRDPHAALLLGHRPQADRRRPHGRGVATGDRIAARRALPQAPAIDVVFVHLWDAERARLHRGRARAAVPAGSVVEARARRTSRIGLRPLLRGSTTSRRRQPRRVSCSGAARPSSAVREAARSSSRRSWPRRHSPRCCSCSGDATADRRTRRASTRPAARLVLLEPRRDIVREPGLVHVRDRTAREPHDCGRTHLGERVAHGGVALVRRARSPAFARRRRQSASAARSTSLPARGTTRRRPPARLARRPHR